MRTAGCSATAWSLDTTGGIELAPRRDRGGPTVERQRAFAVCSRGSRYGTTDRNADAVKPAQTIGADEGIVADGKQVDQVLELTDGTGAGVIVDFQTAIDDLEAARIRGTADRAMLR